MENRIWAEHLHSWKSFLTECLDNTTEEGELIKLKRQLNTIEQVRYGAALCPIVVSEFINPTERIEEEEICDEYYFELNESQKKAVNIALGNGCINLIQGPPGTGKTQVIAEICLQLYKHNPGVRILVCSETHVAVNNLIARIAKHSQEVRIVRIRDKENDKTIDEYTSDSIIENYLDWVSHNIKNEEASKIITDGFNEFDEKSIEKALVLSANIVGMTCNRTAAYDFEDINEMFDVVIIDEVCKATLPEILAPLLITKKAILIGDPKQLPPVFCSEEQEVIKRIENCNLDRYMYIDQLFERANNNVIVLDTQYRMLEPIGDMISNLFYEGNLKNGRKGNLEECITWIDYEPTKEWPPFEEQLSEKPRVYNDDEISIIKELVERLVQNSNADASIAVVAPYRAQVYQLRKACLKSDLVRIDTVDGFQGMESDIVIFSATRSTGPYRFLTDKRRLNVALSRAKNQIIIVGHLKYCEKSKIMREISEYANLRRINLI